MSVEAIPGLLWGYHFDAAGEVTAFEPAALESVLHSGRGWTWLHLNLANARAREWLVRAPLPEPVRHALLDDEELPMLCGIDGVGVGVLADLKREFVGHSTEETARVRFAVSDRLLVTCRRHPLSSVEAAHAAVERGDAFPAPYALIDVILGSFARAVAVIGRDISKELDSIEDRVVFADATDEGDRLGKTRRTALRLHRQLLGQCNLLSTALEEEEQTLPSAFLEVIERAERRVRALDRDIDSLQERAHTLQDEMAAKATTITNRNLYALSIITALFLPATLVTGIFGMNTDGLPWAEDAPNGFYYALILCAMGAGAVYWLLRRMGVTR